MLFPLLEQFSRFFDPTSELTGEACHATPFQDADLTGRSLHCVDYRIGCPPTGHPGSTWADDTVVKAEAFTKKRR